MQEFQKEPLVYLWGNTFPLFNIEAAIGYTVMDDILAAKGEMIMYSSDCYYVSFGKKRLLDEARKYGDLFLRQDVFDEHVAKMEVLFERRAKLIKLVNENNLTAYSNQELFNLVKEYHEIFGRVIGHMVISRPECVDHLSENLIDLLTKQNRDGDEVNKHFAILISPTELDIIKKEQIARLEILKNPTDDDLKKHVLDFPWLYGYKYTRDEAVDELCRDLQKDSVEELERKIADFKLALVELQLEKDSILQKYATGGIKLLSDRLSFLGHNRLEVKSGFAGLQITVSPLFQEISARGEVELKKMLDHYLLADLETLLLENSRLTEAEIQARKKAVFYTQDNQIISIQGEEAEKFVEAYLQTHLQDDKSYVKGTVAAKGYVIGKVRKMTLGDDIDLESLEKGEILVTEMTAPSMVPMMRKCAGIITNEGGIVSHAAIISREFKIPCIVGTGTATQVFETGDYVELDANTGMARKITKEESEKHCQIKCLG
ncbi:MAG: PEP-utilizing enzyme [Parcubacteria group bacterium]